MVKLSIREAYAVYRRMTCKYEGREKLGDIFTEDCIVGNVTWGHMQGLEAADIFFRTAEAMGLPAEDHLWHVWDGDLLVFRFRQYAESEADSPHFGGIGQLLFDERQGKFRYYHGIFDSAAASKLAEFNPDSVPVAIDHLTAATQASHRFQARHPSAKDRLASDQRQLFTTF